MSTPYELSPMEYTGFADELSSEAQLVAVIQDGVGVAGQLVDIHKIHELTRSGTIYGEDINNSWLRDDQRTRVDAQRFMALSVERSNNAEQTKDQIAGLASEAHNIIRGLAVVIRIVNVLTEEKSHIEETLVMPAEDAYHEGIQEAETFRRKTEESQRLYSSRQQELTKARGLLGKQAESFAITQENITLTPEEISFYLLLEIPDNDTSGISAYLKDGDNNPVSISVDDGARLDHADAVRHVQDKTTPIPMQLVKDRILKNIHETIIPACDAARADVTSRLNQISIEQARLHQTSLLQKGDYDVALHALKQKQFELDKAHQKLVAYKEELFDVYSRLRSIIPAPVLPVSLQIAREHIENGDYTLADIVADPNDQTRRTGSGLAMGNSSLLPALSSVSSRASDAAPKPTDSAPREPRRFKRRQELALKVASLIAGNSAT